MSDVRTKPQYLRGLRRGAPLVAVVSLIAAGAVYGIWEAAPESYEATALIVPQGTFVVGDRPTDRLTLQRTLATNRALIGTQSVLAAAAGQLSGATADSLSAGVRTSVDLNANVIKITASDERRANAAQVANVVANTFLAVRAGMSRTRLRAAAADLRLRLARPGGSGPLRQQTIAGLRRRISELVASEGTAGSDLIAVESAALPTQAKSSHAGRNAAIALGIALLAGILTLLARERVTPRVRASSQLRALLDLRVLAEIPNNPRRRGMANHRAMSGEQEAFQALRASVNRPAVPGPLIAAVTSGSDGDGKTTVTANLGRALHHAGHNVLLVAGDLRQPALHAAFDVPNSRGFSELLQDMRPSTSSAETELLAGMIVSVDAADGDHHANLSILPPGAPVMNPGALFSSAAARELFGGLRRLPFDYILIDLPRLPGLVDSQVLVPEADAVLVVARLHHVRLESILRMQETLDLLAVKPFGMVVVGTRHEGAGPEPLSALHGP